MNIIYNRYVTISMNRVTVIPALLVLTIVWIVLYPTSGVAQTTETNSEADTGIELEPFMLNHWESEDSRIDLSFLLDGPAGQNGFVTAEGDRFYTGDGEPIRFWGVNITDWSRGSTQYPPKEDAALWASVLARHGINMVRLHFLDLPAPRGLTDADRDDTRHFDPEQLDRFDWWIYQLREQGIYVNFNLVVGRSYKEGDGVVDYEDVGWAKYITYFDPQLIALQKERAELWLTHENPYTGMRYVDDPAVAMFELLNENTLFDAWHRDALHTPDDMPSDPNFKPITPYYSNMLDDLFNDWLEENYSTDELVVLREQAGVEADEPLSRIRKAEYESTEYELFHATVDFYMHTERNYFEEMKRYLRDDLGLQSLLFGSSDFLHDQSEYPMIWSNSTLDFLGGHVYWQHPSAPVELNTPLVDEPGFSTVMRLSRTALAGKPYVVPEVNHASPNDWESEGFPVLAAYGALQDWSGIKIYTFEPKRSRDFEPFIGDAFDISHHPIKMPQMAIGAMMFLRGDVSTANETLTRNYTMDQIRETLRLPADEHMPWFTPEFDDRLALKHRVRIGSLEGPATREQRMEEEYPIVSDTGELAWYPARGESRGLVTVDTPRSQALIGFLSDHDVSTTNLATDLVNPFASITLSSLDQTDTPISDSSRMLLVAGARAQNTGLQWDENRESPRNRGGHPSLIEVVSGEITLLGLNDASSVQVYELDGSGRWMGESVSAEQSGSDWVFPVGLQNPTTWYEIVVNR